MRFPLRFFPANSKIPFMRLRWLGFAFSIGLMMATIALFFTRGLTLGIDFTGGILMEVRAEMPVELAPLRSALGKGNFGEVSLQHFGDEKELLLRIQAQEGEDQAKKVEKVKQVLAEAIEGELDFRKIDYVGPSVGKELVESAYISVSLAFLAIMVYVWFRFEWQFGVGGILALVHDATMMLGFYLVTGFDFNLTSVAAILTIVGYSINDSVVIYDRIRENMRKYKQMEMAELLNISINETLSRTVLTAGTTALAALALVLFGGESLLGFSAALLFGVVFGTYSSIYVSAPVLLYFNLREIGTASQAPAR